MTEKGLPVSDNPLSSKDHAYKKVFLPAARFRNNPTYLLRKNDLADLQSCEQDIRHRSD